MSPMHDDPMTLERLAELLLESRQDFAAVDKKVEARFATLDTKIESRFSALDQKIDAEIGNLAQAVNRGFTHLEDRMERFEQRLDGVDSRLQSFQTRLDTFLDHERRLNRVERELGIATVE